MFWWWQQELFVVLCPPLFWLWTPFSWWNTKKYLTLIQKQLPGPAQYLLLQAIYVVIAIVLSGFSLSYVCVIHSFPPLKKTHIWIWIRYQYKLFCCCRYYRRLVDRQIWFADCHYTVWGIYGIWTNANSICHTYLYRRHFNWFTMR